MTEPTLTVLATEARNKIYDAWWEAHKQYPTQPPHPVTTLCAAALAQMEKACAAVQAGERLAEYRDLPQIIRRHTWTATEDAADAIRDLMAEVDRLNTQAAFMREQMIEAGKARDALSVAMELLDRLAGDAECWFDQHGYCQRHSQHKTPCPHPLARQLVVAWREVKREVPDA